MIYTISKDKEKLINKFYFDSSALYVNVGPIVYGELAISIPVTKSGRFKLVCKDFDDYAVANPDFQDKVFAKFKVPSGIL